MTRSERKQLLGFLGGVLLTLFLLSGFWLGVIFMLICLLFVATED
jgi:uncharacterized membrane protein